MAASERGRVTVCDILLNRGADVHRANKVWDILYFIVLSVHVNCILILLLFRMVKLLVIKPNNLINLK